VWLAEVVGGTPEPLEDHDELRWLERSDLRAVAWLPADLPIVERLEQMLQAPPAPEPDTRSAS
jgi:8-oxo-dGTP diphosphatase